MLCANKSFFTEKETINKTKLEPVEWEKILANAISDKGLVSKIYKELIQHTYTQKIIQLKIRRYEQTFLQRRHTDGEETHEKMLNITHHQENESKL